MAITTLFCPGLEATSSLRTTTGGRDVKPVEQQVMALFDEQGDNIQRGDCLRAAMASVFELELLEVPHFVETADWWNVWQDWLAGRGLRIGQAFFEVDEDDPTLLTGWPGDIYWLAIVKSPRGRARCSVCEGRGKHRNHRPDLHCAGTGLVPSTHALVMFGREVAWDPHPRRDMGHLGFDHGYDFRAIDPARLELKAVA